MKKAILVLSILIMLQGDTLFAKEFTVGFAMGSGGLGDMSFNDITYQGLAKARQDFKITLILEVPKKGYTGYINVLKKLTKLNLDLIVANGWEYEEPLKKMAKLHPEQHFLINDVPIGDLSNVVSNIYEQHEGSFLAGYLTGLMTKTNKVGFIGGVDITVIHAYRIGYREGVHYANRNIKVFEAFITKGNDFSGFNNPQKGQKLATELYRKGADIIFGAAGLSTNGVIHAAKLNKKYAIGVDSDQDHMAKGFVLTSMMNRLDESTYREISKIIKGNFKPGINTYGLKQGGVSLTPMKFTQHIISNEIIKKLNDVKYKILSGEIKVTNYFDQVKK